MSPLPHGVHGLDHADQLHADGGLHRPDIPANAHPVTKRVYVGHDDLLRCAVAIVGAKFSFERVDGITQKIVLARRPAASHAALDHDLVTLDARGLFTARIGTGVLLSVLAVDDALVSRHFAAAGAWDVLRANVCHSSLVELEHYEITGEPPRGWQLGIR
jgi:hypothetical protein